MNRKNRDNRDERIAELEAENALLREQVELLAAHLQDVQARLAKDSRTSGKPPSSDRLGCKPNKTKSLRRKCGKKLGGQLGHRGETLRLVATPDEVVEHRQTTCTQCHTPLQTAAVVLRERRQVQELPPLRLCVTEHEEPPREPRSVSQLVPSGQQLTNKPIIGGPIWITARF